MYVTFIFSGPNGKVRSPAEGTYRTEPNSECKLPKRIRRQVKEVCIGIHNRNQTEFEMAAMHVFGR